MFLVKADLSSGTYELIHDFGEAGQQPFTGEVSIDEMAATSVHTDWFTRETETDMWQPMGGVGAEAVDSNPSITSTRSRYVKVVVTKTGTPDTPSGILGQ